MKTPKIVEFHNNIRKSGMSLENKQMLLSKSSITKAKDCIVAALENEYNIELDYAYSLLPGQEIVVIESNNINLN